MTLDPAGVPEAAGTPAAAGGLPEPDELGWVDRFTDRCNAILVREVQQALASRAFMMTLSTAVSAVVLLALMFSWFGDDDAQRGVEAFAWCIACLAPIVILFVPMQSFASMRQEVGGGTAEQLLMTRLRPSRIVLGKALAGLAQLVLFLGVFAPLMALTFLLRGVDVPTIGMVLLFAVLSSVAANVFALALASVGSTRPVQQAMHSLATAGLFIATFAAMAGAYELPREIASMFRDPDFWAMFLSILGAYVVGIWLFGMIATASLAHGYENRSSPFRAFAVGVLLLLAGWLLGALSASRLDAAPGIASATFALCLLPFWLWAACEEPGLSPRVRTLVPRRAPLALLSAPFLPGGGRGMLFGLVLAAVGIAVGCGLPALAGVRLDRRAGSACVLAWLYVPIVAGMGRTLRARLPRGRRFSWLSFVVTVFALVVLSLLPLLFLLMVGEHVDSWNVGHVFNPFFTVLDGHRHGEAGLALGVLALLAVAATTRSMVRGIREVLDASAARRSLVG